MTVIKINKSQLTALELKELQRLTDEESSKTGTPLTVDEYAEKSLKQKIYQDSTKDKKTLT